jgi:hypothetical protein
MLIDVREGGGWGGSGGGRAVVGELYRDGVLEGFIR